MYSTCIFCTRPLGANEAVATFPVGRRLAFDPAKGRLWVVCRKCERWNLSPIEERWEAIDECDRFLRDTRTRVSTESIGLARLAKGLDLVRVGAPQRPEFAAWRYGDQFGRRLRRAVIRGVGATAAIGGVGAGLTATGLISGFLISQVPAWMNLAWQVRLRMQPRMQINTDAGETIRVTAGELEQVRVIPFDDERRLRVVVGENIYEGDDARRILAATLPAINSTGGSKSVVQEAVRQIEDTGNAAAFFDHAIRNGHVNRRLLMRSPAGLVARYAPPVRLALEMALHEEQERRALEGELNLLEAAWRDAEEIAAISDDLTLPDEAHEFIEQQRSEARTPRDRMS
jgi:hypothetical protein